MGRHRVRPRYGRFFLAGASALVTGVAVLGGMGVIDAETSSARAAGSLAAVSDVSPDAGGGAAAKATDDVTSDLGGDPSAPTARESLADSSSDNRSDDAAKTRQPGQFALPARSGHGRRVVFSETRQRVWLVAKGGRVRSTYLVSGSVYDNLEPGAFEVYSRSEDAIGIDDSGTMKFFVRFTQGDTGAAIGFHDIPVDDGQRVQEFDELGTPQSHGCIRQRRPDARKLWAFAPIGTPVVVTA